jgi:2-polyprenyl-3-methyl-5-hydroxy-6-metoxy-1,4-benzoquinol methylase
MEKPILDRQAERESLEQIAADSWYAAGANGESVRYCGRVFERFFRGHSCLELGPAEGLMSEVLVPRFQRMVMVDGSRQFCDELRRRFPRAEVVNSLFEDYETDERFDTIVISHVLEHVDDPVSLLATARRWLADDGRLIAAVPNARSVHRQAAVLMGLLPEEHAMNATDAHHGHRRVYDPESFRHDFARAGLRVEVFGGYWLKPLSNAQLEAQWTPEMRRAYLELGERYPDIAAEIYVVARHPG